MSHCTTNSSVTIDIDIGGEGAQMVEIVGGSINPSVTAVLFIEYQNDFVHSKGALYSAIESELKRQNMLSNSKRLLDFAREHGFHIIHAPITYCAEYEENANRYGVLYNVATSSAFEEKKWGALYHSLMEPLLNESIVKGKHGLDSFSGTNLDDILQGLGIVNLLICGCLTNCCVESTMRTAYEFGYNVITIHDCCVATSQEEHENSVNHTFKMFSIPISSKEFTKFIMEYDVIDVLMSNKSKELPPSSVMHSRQKVEYFKMKSNVEENMIARLVNLVVLIQLLITSMELGHIDNEMIEIVLLYIITVLDFIMTLLLFSIWFYCYDRSKYENDDSLFPINLRKYRAAKIKFIFKTLNQCISIVAVSKLIVCVLFGVKRVSKQKNQQKTIISSIVFTIVSGIFELIYTIYESVNQ